MYDKIEAGQYGVKSESEVLEFWKKNGIIEKAIDKNDGTGEEFTFYDGPPTANGKPHVGHILTRVIKDIIPRYKTMKGFHCHRKAGWDTHGLPVELEVEKTLGIDGKQEIEKYGVEKFIGKCYVAEAVGELKAEDAENLLQKAKNADPEAAKRLLMKGSAFVSAGAAKVFAEAGIWLFGNESQTVGPEDAPAEVHHILLGAEVVLLEGIRLGEVSEGVYLLNAAPINLGGCDGAPCRAILMEL